MPSIVGITATSDFITANSIFPREFAENYCQPMLRCLRVTYGRSQVCHATRKAAGTSGPMAMVGSVEESWPIQDLD